MKTIKVQYWKEIPKNYTGVIEWEDGSKFWYKEGKKHREDEPALEFANGTKYWFKDDKRHRENGPACEFSDGDCWWFLEDKEYYQKNLKDYVVLDSYQGNYGLMWYRLLDKDKVFEYPNIPGLITK